MKIIKLFGLGLLYALLLPFILVAAVLFLVFGFFKSIGYFFILVVRFFKGEKLFPPFPEDIEAAKRIRAKLVDEGTVPPPAPAPQPAPSTSNVYVQQNYYSNPNMPGAQPGAVPPPQPNLYFQPGPGYGPAMPPYPQGNPQQMGMNQQPGYIANQPMPNQQVPQNPFQGASFNPNPQPAPEPIDLTKEDEDDSTFTMIEQQGGSNND